MTFLLVGDLHIMDRTIVQFNEFSLFIFELIAERRPAKVVLLGDILHFHNKVDVNYLNVALGFIDRLRKECEVVLLAGNHDKINQEAFLQPNTWMNALKYWEKVQVVDFPVVVGEVLYCPHVPAGRFREALQKVSLSGVKVIFCHQEFKGCLMNHFQSVNGDDLSETEDFPLVISGHIHKKQRLGQRVFYPGTPYPTAHDESGGIVVLFHLDSLRTEEISTRITQKETITLRVVDLRDDLEASANIKYIIEGTRTELALFRKSKLHRRLSSKSIVRFSSLPDALLTRETSQGGFSEQLELAFLKYDEPTLSTLREMKLRLL